MSILSDLFDVASTSTSSRHLSISNSTLPPFPPPFPFTASHHKDDGTTLLLQINFPASLALTVKPETSLAVPKAAAVIDASVSGTLNIAIAITASTSKGGPSASHFHLRLSAPRLILDDANMEIATTADFVDASGAAFAGINVIAHLSLSAVTLAWPVPRALYDGLPSNSATMAIASGELVSVAVGGITAGGSLSLRLEPVRWPNKAFAHVDVPSAALSTALGTAALCAPSYRIAGALPSRATAGFRAILARLFASALLLPEPPQRTGFIAMDGFSAQSAFRELSVAINASLNKAEATASGWTDALCAPRQLGAFAITFPTCGFGLDAAGTLSLNITLRLEKTFNPRSILRPLLVTATTQAAAIGILPKGTSIVDNNAMEDLSLPDVIAQQHLDLEFALSLDLASGFKAEHTTFTLVSLDLATRLAVQKGSATLGQLTFDALGVSLVAYASVKPSTSSHAAAVALRRTSLRILNSQLATSLSNLFLAQQAAVFAGQVRLAARVSTNSFKIALPVPDALLTYTDEALYDGKAGAAAVDVNLDTAALRAMLTKPASLLAQIVGDSGISSAYGLPAALSGVTTLLNLSPFHVADEFASFSRLAAEPPVYESGNALEIGFGVGGADAGPLLPALVRLIAASNADLVGAALLSSPLRLVSANGSTLLWDAGLGMHVAAALSVPDVISSACLDTQSGVETMNQLRCLVQAALPPIQGARAALAYAWQRLRAGAEGLLGEGASTFAAVGATSTKLASSNFTNRTGGLLGMGRVGFSDIALAYDAARGETTIALRVAGGIHSNASAAGLSAVEIATGAAMTVLSEAGASSFVGTHLDGTAGSALGLPSSLDLPDSPSVTLTSTFDMTLHIAIQLGGSGAPTTSARLSTFQANLAVDIVLLAPLNATLSNDIDVELDDVSVRVSGGLTLQTGSYPVMDLHDATKMATVDAIATLRLRGATIAAAPAVLLALADDNLLDSAAPLLTVDVLLDSDRFDQIMEALNAVLTLNASIFDNDELEAELPLLKTRLVDLLDAESTDVAPDLGLPDMPASTGLRSLLSLAAPAQAYRNACGSACTARGLGTTLRQHILGSINGALMPAIAGRNVLSLLSGLTEARCALLMRMVSGTSAVFEFPAKVMENTRLWVRQ